MSLSDHGHPCNRLRGIICALWLLLAGGAAGFSPPTLGDGGVFAPSLTSADLAALRGASALPSSVRAVAATIVDGATGHPLASRNAGARLAPASLTKMMTALVAIERFSLADPIVATPRSRSEPAIIGLDPGDSLSLENMLYGLLLTSGNDAALAIAETVGGGSIERFVGWMNERASTMGLKNTRFMNPTGLDDPGQYSSARDLAEIARALMAEATLARIVGTPRHVVQGPPLWFFASTNPILGTAPGVDGIKTGYTDDAGRCFAASATRNGHRIVAVMLNSPNIAQEAQVLLDAGFAMARHVTLDASRPGFGRLEEDRSPRPGRPLIALAGWETSLLRGFTAGEHTTVLLAGQPVARW